MPNIKSISDFARYDLVLMGFIFTAVVLVLVMLVFDMIQKRALPGRTTTDAKPALTVASSCMTWGDCPKMSAQQE